jgi:hypothetical protein
MELQLQADE